MLLRGVNVNQLVDFYRPRPEVDDTRPLTEDDFAGIAEQGFNVVRLGISWSALEPERGELDAGLSSRRSTKAVDQAKEHGLYVVLDMHQDSWWNEGTPEGTACRPGTDPMWGYDGAPAWATITDGAPRCQFQGRDISPASDRAFQNFYFDTDGVQSALVATWGEARRGVPRRARRRGLRPAERARLRRDRAGDDLLPARPLLRPRDRRDPRRGSRRRSSSSSPASCGRGSASTAARTPGFTSDANIVFSPHLYAESITMDRSLGLPPIVSMERQFELAQRVADSYGMPLWSGEYGYWGDDADRSSASAATPTSRTSTSSAAPTGSGSRRAATRRAASTT